MENGEKGGDRNFEYAAYAEPDVVGKYLEDLARYIREGHVHLAVGNEGIQLDMGASVKLAVEASVKSDKGKGSLHLGISWRQTQQNGDALRIEATGPEPAKEKSKGKNDTELEIGSKSANSTSAPAGGKPAKTSTKPAKKKKVAAKR